MLSWVGLRSRLTLLVLAALVPVFALFVWLATEHQQAYVLQAQTSLRTQALLVAAHQQRQIDRTAQLLFDIASAPAVKEMQPLACAQYVANLKSQSDDYFNLGAAGLDGRVLCHAAAHDREANVGKQSYFHQVVATQAFSVGQYGLGSDGNSPGIALGFPVYDSKRVFNGVAFATLKVAALEKVLRAATLPEGAQLRLIDRRGIILAAYPPSAGVPGTPEHNTALLAAVQKQQPGSHEAMNANGINHVYAYAPVNGAPHGGMSVTIRMPRDLITAAPRKLLLVDLAALLGITLLGLMCAWIVGKRLVVNPAMVLLRVTSEITRGNLQARVQLGPMRQDEMGRLGHAFNQLAAALQVQRDELDGALHRADEERATLNIIFNSLGEGVIAVDASNRFSLFNLAAQKIFDAPAPNMLFGDWRSSKHLYALDMTMPAKGGPLVRALQGASTNNQDMVHVAPGAPDRILRTSAWPLRGPDQQQIGALAVFVDVTELKAAERHSLAQEKVLVLIASLAPVRESLEAVVRLIEQSAPESRCSISMVEGSKLRHSIAPSLPPDFAAAVNGILIAEGVGACGTAAFRRETVIIEDVEQDPLTRDFRELLALHHLRSCWSTPVMASDGMVLATFAIYRRTPGLPRAADLALIATATHLARLALERMRAEGALVQSETRFRELAANVEDVFYNIDVHNRTVRYISPAYEKLSGRSCESLYAAPGSYRNAILPADRSVMALARKRNKAGHTADVEYRIRAADGRICWVRDRSYPMANAAGEFERIVGTARDITNSKNAELALAATHRATRMLSLVSMAINRIQDEAGLLAEACRVAVDDGGYRMAWVGYAVDNEEKSIRPAACAGVEQNCLKHINPSCRADHPGGQGPAGRAMRTGMPQYTSDLRKPGINPAWREVALKRGFLSALALPLRSENQTFGVLCLCAGRVQHFSLEEIKLLQELADNLAFGIIALRNRLEKWRSEAAERTSAAKVYEQASLLDLAPGAIVVCNQDLSIRFWSQGAERLYGWPAEKVLGLNMQTLMYPDPHRLAAAMEQISASNGDWTGEAEQATSDGSPVYVEMRATVVRDASGQANGVMIINTDMRERRQAQQEILLLNTSLEERVQQRTEQLNLANQQLEAFSYSVSHDLRGPLSTINGFCSLLSKSIAGPDATPLSERGQHYLARIHSGVKQMGELIDALLSLAHVSRSNLAWEAVDLSWHAAVVLASLQENDAGRTALLDIQPGLVAQGDPCLLKQVLYNLLGNAWKFSSAKACTCISLGRTQSAEGEWVYFVRDQGAGFDMAHSDKLFGAFQRLHTEAEFSGTGIGLATAQRIIARHGGRVWANAAIGAGATFYFTLGAQAA